NAGAVHQNVHGSELSRDPRKELIERRIICDVTLRRQRASTTLANRDLERARRRFLLAESKADGGAALRQQVDDPGADAAGAAGDDGDAAAEREVRRLCWSDDHHCRPRPPQLDVAKKNPY